MAAGARAQESRVVRVIKKQLVKRALEMLKEVTDRPVAEGKPSDFNTLWESFGKYIKLGAIEDTANKRAPGRLPHLLHLFCLCLCT